ncbi:11080_t:CDS:2, partial [Funneliformis caledonium]
MTKQRKINISLISPGVLVEKYHYGSYSRYWWQSLLNSEEITTYFPIQVKQTIKAMLNNCEFIITVVVGNKDNNIFLLSYMCQCNEIVGIANNLTNAISEVYSKIFATKTRYSDSLIIGWNDENIVNELNKDHCAGLGYKSSLLHKFRDKQALFISKIKETLCTVEIYQDQKLQTTYLFIKWDEQESPLIELNNELHNIYPENHQFSIREKSAWQTFLHAAGANNVTPWPCKEQYQFWSKSNYPEQDHALLTQLYQMKFLVKDISTPIKNSTLTFWQCFNQLQENLD